jgi:hypothetical protein
MDFPRRPRPKFLDSIEIAEWSWLPRTKDLSDLDIGDSFDSMLAPLVTPPLFNENESGLLQQWEWTAPPSQKESPAILPDTSQTRLKNARSDDTASDLGFEQDWFDFDSWQAENPTDVGNLSLGNQPMSDELSKLKQRSDTRTALIESDMNDPKTLELYSQLLPFSKDPTQQKWYFSNSDYAKQVTLRGLALKLHLQYTDNGNSQIIEKRRNSIDDSSCPFPEHNGFEVDESDIYQQFSLEKESISSMLGDLTAPIPPLNELHQSSISTMGQNKTSDQSYFPISQLSCMVDDQSGSVSSGTRRGCDLMEKSSNNQWAPERGKSLSSTERGLEPNTTVFRRYVSPSPGRRGPLDTMTRAGIRALKAVGACWRCKILRKKVHSVLPIPKFVFSSNATIV